MTPEQLCKSLDTLSVRLAASNKPSKSQVISHIRSIIASLEDEEEGFRLTKLVFKCPKIKMGDRRKIIEQCKRSSDPSVRSVRSMGNTIEFICEDEMRCRNLMASLAKLANEYPFVADLLACESDIKV